MMMLHSGHIYVLALTGPESDRLPPMTNTAVVPRPALMQSDRADRLYILIDTHPDRLSLVRDILTSQLNWPAPIPTYSGLGFQIDLPATTTDEDLAAVFASCALLFDEPTTLVDRGAYVTPYIPLGDSVTEPHSAVLVVMLPHSRAHLSKETCNVAVV